MKKKILTVNILLLLIIMSLGGCRRAEGADGTSSADNAELSDNVDSSDHAVTYDYTEPPVIELRNTADETNFVIVRPSGYTWTFLEGDGRATGGVADCADPLTENAPWDILDMTDNASGEQNYAISIPIEPDELMVEAWSITDIGKRSYECPTLEGCIYSREELTADNFSIPIQPGRVYVICLTWNEEKAEENGFYGVVTYTFITKGEVEEEQLTGLDNEEKALEEITGEVYTEQIDELTGVKMIVSAVTAEGATVTCTNSTDKEIVFGDDYELQVQKDGKWYQVKYTIDNAAFNAIGYSLLQDMSLDWDVNWTYFHGSLPPGKYRITKTALDFRGTGEFTEYNLAAEFYILNDEENKELTEANEKAFYEAAESFGLEKAETEGYFQLLCQDEVIQNGVMELSGLVIDDFDQNGQTDFAIMVQEPKMKFLYGTGFIYFYMNGEEPYCFYDEEVPFYNFDSSGAFNISSGDLDHDGYTEIVFGTMGTGNNGTGDWHNRILKYKDHTMERMAIPSEEQDIDGCISVMVTKEETENTYRASCAYLNDEIVFEARNLEGDYCGGGSNCRGFYDVQCVAYGDGYALQASEYLYGEGGIAHGVADAKFLIVWDEDGSSHVEKWWIEPYQY